MKISVKLIKSLFGRKPKHKAAVNGLGIKRINQTVELEDTPSIRGMINKISYLLEINSGR